MIPPRQQVAVLGYGKEGQSVQQHLRKLPGCQHARIVIIPRVTSNTPVQKIARFDLLIRSPGIPLSLPLFSWARRRHIPITSATNLFFAFLPKFFPKRKIKVIGVTGTKGKSTTATLIARGLRSAGYITYLGGNIGTSPLSLLIRLRNDRAKIMRHPSPAMVVLELSSFQLQDLNASPSIAVVLDIFPDHLDVHRSIAEYYRAKRNIVQFQNKRNLVVFCPKNRISTRIAASSKGKHIPITESLIASFTKSLSRVDKPFLHNAAAAATVLSRLGVPRRTIERTICSFRGLPHRLQLVHTTRISPGRVRWYNDSAATNPTAAAAAIRSFSLPCTCILGGKSKHIPYTPILHAVANHPSLQSIVLTGENRNELKRVLAPLCRNLRIATTPTLQQAVRHAIKDASRFLAAHSSCHEYIILFSPGAASFDAFSSYRERGVVFQKLAKTVRLQ